MERNDQTTDGQNIPNNVVQFALRVAKEKPAGEKPVTAHIYEVGNFGERREKREIWEKLVQDFATWSPQFYRNRTSVYKTFSRKHFPVSGKKLDDAIEDLFVEALKFTYVGQVSENDSHSITLALPKAEYDARKMQILQGLGQLSTSSQSR